MVSKLVNKIMGSLLSLAVLVGCSNTPNFTDPGSLEILQDENDIQAESLNSPEHQAFGDIAVKFNNAYQALYEDNERTGRADPDNTDKLFIKIMREAKKSLDVAVFDIDEPGSCHALIDAQKRGVKVRVLTDSDNLGESGNPSVPRRVLQEMRKAGIKIKDDKRTAFMHHKFVIMDDKVVLTGSTNLTENSLFRDNNNSLKISSPELAANYKAEFNRMYDKGILGPNPHEMPFNAVKVDGANIRVYFSPKGGTKEAILNELRGAKRSIRFMTFSLTDKDIQKILFDKVDTGKTVEGIFDGCMISEYSLYYSMLRNKIPVLIDGNQAILHDKIFIIDNNTVITGSYNFSNNAELSNNENTLVIKSTEIAKFYNAEFDRLKRASINNKNLPPYDNRTCMSHENGNDNDLDNIKPSRGR
jgi:phosphatidylserine/phosphatidylglycerophosphate/cardiolipin synthase-like enzyme